MKAISSNFSWMCSSPDYFSKNRSFIYSYEKPTPEQSGFRNIFPQEGLLYVKGLSWKKKDLTEMCWRSRTKIQVSDDEVSFRCARGR